MATNHMIRRAHRFPRPPIHVLLGVADAAALALGVCLIVWWTGSVVHRTAEREAEHDMEMFAATFAPLVCGNAADIRGLVEALGTKYVAGGRLRITIIAEDGTVLGDTNANTDLMENHLARKEVQVALSGGRGSDVRRSTVTGDDVMYYARTVELDGIAAGGEDDTAGSNGVRRKVVLRLAVPLAGLEYNTAGIRTKATCAAVAVFAMMLALTSAVSAYIVSGIDGLSVAAEHYKTGDFDYRVRRRAPREVAALGDTMADMAQEMKRLEVVRKDFVSNVSHELKTPVTAIIGFSETLLDGVPPEQESHFLEIINTQSHRLMAIIEDLLTLSRLEHDSRKPEMMVCDIVSITHAICDSFVPLAAERQTVLAFETGVETLWCMLNAHLYEEALGNIIDNAIKYCPAASHILCKVERGGNSGTMAVIIVEDDGPGIGEKYRARIFERFFRIDKGRSRDCGGTGLGLSIATHIVKSHGGTLREEDRSDGKSGARFVIELPRLK